MTPLSRLSLLLYLVARAVSQTIDSAHVQELIHNRHESSYADKKADKSYPVSVTSQLMLSPCHPEDNGYFGATSGTPVKLEYGFEMETEKDADVANVLSVIDEKVMDEVLSASFPSICGFGERSRGVRRDLEATKQIMRFSVASKVTGFHFSRELADRTRPCTPSVNPENTCKIYYNKIVVYGHFIDQNTATRILTQARNIVNGALFMVAEDGVLRLRAWKDLASQEIGPLVENELEEDNVPVGALIGLILSSVALVVGVVVLVCYFRSDDGRFDHVSDDASLPLKSKSSHTTSLGSFRYFDKSGTHTDDDTKSGISSIEFDLKRGYIQKISHDPSSSVEFEFDPDFNKNRPASALSSEPPEYGDLPPLYLDEEGRFLDEF